MQQIITASRRTDLPGQYAAWLAARIRDGEVSVPQPYNRGARLISLSRDEVHSFVLMSKDFGPTLANTGGLRDALERYDNLYCQFTVTGLGGSYLEPRVPPPEEALGQLVSLSRWLGNGERIMLRFDPIIHWWGNGVVRSNVGSAKAVFRACAQAGVKKVRISFAAIYRKMAGRGVDWFDPTQEQKLEIAAALVEEARTFGLEVHACAQPFLAAAGVFLSGCVDGAELSRLHPRMEPAQRGKAKGQRHDCLCSPSVDIGSYDMPCAHGCCYCYARPQLT